LPSALRVAASSESVQPLFAACRIASSSRMPLICAMRADASTNSASSSMGAPQASEISAEISAGLSAAGGGGDFS
jgi:hypothetical protein